MIEQARARLRQLRHSAFVTIEIILITSRRATPMPFLEYPYGIFSLYAFTAIADGPVSFIFARPHALRATLFAMENR